MNFTQKWLLYFTVQDTIQNVSLTSKNHIAAETCYILKNRKFKAKSPWYPLETKDCDIIDRAIPSRRTKILHKLIQVYPTSFIDADQ